MADAGRIKHHLKHNLMAAGIHSFVCRLSGTRNFREKNLDGQKKVRIHGEQIAVKANVERIDDFQHMLTNLVYWNG